MLADPQGRQGPSGALRIPKACSLVPAVHHMHCCTPLERQRQEERVPIPRLLAKPLWEKQHSSQVQLDLRYSLSHHTAELLDCVAEQLQCAIAQAAGTIHGDFERGFICADVMRYEELHELGSEAAVKANGKLRQEGKTYLVNDGCVADIAAG